MPRVLFGTTEQRITLALPPYGPLAPLIPIGVLKENMSMSCNYLLACWGDGPGNLAPVLTAARRLRRRV
jgi:hypothetical protein